MKGPTALAERVASLIPTMTPVLTADALACGCQYLGNQIYCWVCCVPHGTCTTEYCSLYYC